MSWIRLSAMKFLRDSAKSLLQTHPFQTQNTHNTFTKYAVQIHGQPFCCIDHRYHTKARNMGILSVNDIRGLGPESTMDSNGYTSNRVNSLLPTMPNLHFRKSSPMISMAYLLNQRSYSSFFGSKGNESTRADTAAASGASDSNITDSGLVGNEWFDKVKHGWQSAMDAATFTGQKAKEASSGLTPYAQELLDANPYLKDVVVPIGYTLTGTILAWFVMPRVLRWFHKYAMQGPASILVGDVPYEKSFWSALEDPVRYLITFMAFSQIGMMVAPTTIASQYIAPAWRGAVILSFVWFLYRWKTNVLGRALASQSRAGLNREKLLTLDKLSSVGLFALGIMAFAEACGVAVQSILTVGGIGGVATAFAARDILGNVLSGLSMQFAKPFSLGDTIKAGSIEGQVVEMGLTTTSLLNAEKFPVIVPNSLFSSQVIVNKSRAQWRAIVTKIPLHIDTLDKIPKISEDIKTMLESNANIFLGKERPYCYLSRIDSSFAELTVGCNLKLLSKGELYTAQQDILLQSVQLIKNHGGTLGISTLPE